MTDKLWVIKISGLQGFVIVMQRRSFLPASCKLDRKIRIRGIKGVSYENKGYYFNRK